MSETAEQERADKLDSLRSKLAEQIGDALDKSADPLEKAELEKRNAEIVALTDEVIAAARDSESSEVTALKDRLAKLEAEPASAPASLTGPSGDEPETKQPTKRYDGNYYLDKREAARGDQQAREKLMAYEGEWFGPAREKAWATGDLEDVNLIVPEVQEALPFLAAAAKIAPLCRTIQISSPAVDFPRYTSGLTTAVVADGAPVAEPPDAGSKPPSEPAFTLESARAFTIAGLTEVPNSTLEDYAAARGWIASELGRSVGAREDVLILSGAGTGATPDEPLGILADTDVPSRPIDAVGGATLARNIVTSIFRAMQDCRQNGFVEPTASVLNPAVWTDVALGFEDGIGFLLGPPQGAGLAENEPSSRLLGLPVVQDAYVPTNAGTGTDESPVIVGDFQDAVVLRRTPFRVDVSTERGFLTNSTWFRGEERMGFLVVRPASFEVVEGVVPTGVAS